MGNFKSTHIYAAKYGDVKTLTQALEAGVDIDAKDNDGRTAALWAAGNGHADCALMIEAEIEHRSLVAEIPKLPLATTSGRLRIC